MSDAQTDDGRTGDPVLDPVLDPAIADRLTRNADGLIAAVVQDATSGRVLMMAWMDDAALAETLSTRRGVYFSRSRGTRWVKGETSGHVQYVRGVEIDCDGDTILLRVDQSGAACHNGTTSCFDTATLLEEE
ncbi:phosphoribosyl-AMP cyclohydrolase [Dietzia sp. PP-33]|jgi:phosphoribosyl-AMP cyclohydrolase|uniref:phosphoribosyl-AMP cyclohydrolase n=1 Tax=Dietzia sp. PP-33 TaxID=2957500 RepID=UPI0029B6E701|nr:phosphoribosyl-AMP cyclohydrolase [Dietzia sp. PP-33]MDX2357283.1 phosphoribosyl-AMP cyclohydrolase [Dietzia sp. PP-33]